MPHLLNIKEYLKLILKGKKNAFHSYHNGLKGFNEYQRLRLSTQTPLKIYPLTDFQSLFFLLPHCIFYVRMYKKIKVSLLTQLLFFLYVS